MKSNSIKRYNGRGTEQQCSRPREGCRRELYGLDYAIWIPTTRPTCKRKRRETTSSPRQIFSPLFCSTRKSGCLLPLILILFLAGLPSVVKATLACDPTSAIFGDEFCARKLHPGSVCNPILGRCTNAFAQGCLRGMLGTEKFADLRTCNSNDVDATNTMSGQNCLVSPFNYTEIRIHAGNWDSSLALAWIYQIFLSERLQIPVTIVGKSAQDEDEELCFYHLDNAFGYADQAYDWDALEMSNFVEGGDCHFADMRNLPCAHVIPQIWGSAQQRWDQAVQEQTIVSNNTSNNNDMMGKTNLYIPQRTAQRYPALVSFYGLQNASPQQLAQIFQQPFTWGYFCQSISTSKCSQADSVAYRVPMTTEEAFSFYQPGLYTGYFGNATNRGHVIAPSSCDDFASNTVEAQLYWNNISLHLQGPLPPNQGYDLDHMRQIFKAANATQSDVIMWWWSPDSLVEMFRGTEYQMQAVVMPEYSGVCAQHEVSAEAICSFDLLERLGSENGACDAPGNPLRQAMARSLQNQQLDTDEVHQSPAYDSLRNIRVTDLDMKGILRQWGIARKNNSLDRQFGYEIREAVCTWVADHIEDLDAAIPVGFPRSIKDAEEYDQSYLVAAQAVAAMTSLLVLFAGIATVYCRKRLAVVYAQCHFVLQILLGFWLLAMAAILYGKEPSDTRCLLSVWLTILGFTFALVPLAVKVATINYMAVMVRKDRDQHITIFPAKMASAEIALAICAIMYLMVWTAYDPPSRVEMRVLHMEDGNNTFETSASCSSGSDGWAIASFDCQVLLLVCTTVLYILSWRVVEEFKESKALGRMIYCQDAFLVARVLLFWRRDAMEAMVYHAVLSFLLSIGALAPFLIYFVPMFLRIAYEESDEETIVFYQYSPGFVAGDTSLAAQSRPSNEPRPVRGSYQSTLDTDSAGDSGINALIQAHMTVTRQRQGAGGPATHSGEGTITAQCSRSLDPDDAL